MSQAPPTQGRRKVGGGAIVVGGSWLVQNQFTDRREVDGARDFCNRRGMNYLMTSTDTPVDKLVASYLRKRGLVR